MMTTGMKVKNKQKDQTMKIAKIFLLPAVAVLLVGCQSKEEPQTIEKEQLVFTATIENATKTTIEIGETGKVFWVPGDEIYINGVTFVATPDTDNAARATFNKKNSNDADPATINGKYYASYAFEYDAAEASGILPATQSYDGTQVCAPMYAESATTTLSFSNICGLIGINLTAKESGAVVKSITVAANEDLCGDFEIVSGAASLTDAGGSNIITVNCGSGIALSTSEAKPFYVALPAGTYSDLNFTVNFSDGGLQAFSRSSNMAISANMIYPINKTVESKTYIARYSNNGGNKWTYTQSLAAAIDGISTSTTKDNGKVELLKDDAIGANNLNDISGKKFTLDGNDKTYDISGRTKYYESDADTDVTFDVLCLTVRTLRTSNASSTSWEM